MPGAYTRRPYGVSIQTLMEEIVSGPRPAAPQPNGLTVQMRPYQVRL
jgi:hypothetical protein